MVNALYRLDRNCAGFDIEAFSHFKHGSRLAAQQFGTELATYLWETLPAASADEVVIIASCYKYVPVAAQALADQVIVCLNRARTLKNLAPIVSGRIYRDQLFERDYSTLDDNDRRQLLAEDQIAIDADSVRGRHVIVLDDIRISGGHEKLIDSLLSSKKTLSVSYCYLAAFDELPSNPAIESELNHKSITRTYQIYAKACQGDLVLNSRAIKFLLSNASASELYAWLPSPILEELYKGVLGNGYGLMPRFAQVVDDLTDLFFPVIERLATIGDEVTKHADTISCYNAGSNAKSFQTKEYSRYKYGSIPDGRKLGLALGKAIWEHHLRYLTDAGAPTLLIPAHGNVPIGATLLADWAAYYINHRRFILGLPPATLSKASKHNIAEGDYGKLNQSERAQRVAQESVSFVPEHLTNKHVVVIDDLLVTGQSAKAMRTTALEYQVTSYLHAAVAKVPTEEALAHPEIESYLNHQAVSSLADLLQIWASERFVLNQRVCKFVLDPVQFNELSTIVDSLPSEMRESLYNACLADGLNAFAGYAPSFQLLAKS